MAGDKRLDQMGKSLGAEFSDQDYQIKIAIVQRVDEVNLKADLKILTGTAAEQKEISISQGMAGPRSFWGGIPEEGSLVIVGYRRIQSKLRGVTILGYVPSAIRTSLRFDPVAPDDPANVDPEDDSLFKKLFGETTRFKRLYLRPGDVGGMSSAGAELTLKDGVWLSDRSGDFLELRDYDRTFVISSIHRVENEAGIRRVSGPIRRSAFFLPDDIFEEFPTLRNQSSTPPYYGQDELQEAGPGATAGREPKFANGGGQVLDLFNDYTQFPPVTYSNGKKVHYPTTLRGVGLDDDGGLADAFIEQRMEMSHTSDLIQEVVEEIDGFTMDRRLPYIEQVFGTVVGNSLNSKNGQQNYGQILKPKLFEDFTTNKIGKFELSAVDRKPTSPDDEVNTLAGGYLFRLRPPQGTAGEGNAFSLSVSKQGKFFLNAPASTFEEYPSGSKGISGEVSLGGALKAYLGASTPDRISAHITLEGGVHLDIGRDAQGNAVTTHYHSGVKTIADGNPNADDLAVDNQIRGVKKSTITGREETIVDGSRIHTTSGMYKTEADRYNLNAISGGSFNMGELSMMVSGKTQLNYGLQVLENIALGGKIVTILAGGYTQTILAGAATYTTAAGATTFNNPAGAFTVNVGTGAFTVNVGAGAISLNTAVGAVSLGAAAGAISLTAGLALNLTSAVALNLTAPQVLVGGPAAVLGVARGSPTMPPGAPSLDILTAIPLFGSAAFRSFL